MTVWKDVWEHYRLQEGIFRLRIYTCKKHSSLPHDTSHVAYIPKFRPTEVPVCVRSSRQWSSVPQNLRELGVISPKSVSGMPYLLEMGALLSFSGF